MRISKCLRIMDEMERRAGLIQGNTFWFVQCGVLVCPVCLAAKHVMSGTLLEHVFCLVSTLTYFVNKCISVRP